MEPIRSLVLEDLDKVGRFLRPGDPGKEPTPLTELTQLARVNIFVGANNSGKSRLLRHLAHSKRFLVKAPDDVQVRVLQLESRLATARDAFLSRSSDLVTLTAYGKIKLAEIPTEIPRHRELGADSLAPTREFFDTLRHLQPNEVVATEPKKPTGNVIQSKHDKHELREQLVKSGIDGWKLLEGLPPSNLPAPKRAYYPVLRGLRPLAEAPKDPYRQRTLADHFKPPNSGAPEVVTGLDLHEKTRALLLGLLSERGTIRDYQSFLSRVFFEGSEVTLVPREGHDVLYVKIGHEHDRPIFDLGDGIQQAIILTFLPFTRQEPTFFFIEEPEVHMHPGLQRKLLDFYSQHEACKRHHFFLTTHSNHLLDMTADFDEVSVINFRKRIPPTGGDEREPEFLVEPVEGGDERSLQLLGVRNSSVFLVNATIWVEGITDRLYLRRFLQLYEEKHKVDEKLIRLQEDVHYSIVEYGGSNITHWSWLQDEEGTPSITVERLCGRVFLLADQDGEDKKLARKVELKAKLGERFEVIPGREVENLLPRSTIRAVVLEHEQEANVLPLDKMPEHKDEPLGSYIEGKILVGPRQRKGSYAVKGKSGRLDDKVAFANRALKYLNDYDELSAETRGLIERIRSFVKNQNS